MRSRASIFAPALLTSLALTCSLSCSKDDGDGAAAKTYPKDPIDDVKVTTSTQLPGLQEPVRVVRDNRGMVHIYARNLHDAALADGYMVALDRAPQLQIFRRLAEGRLAEYAGNLQKDLADQDIFFRTLGLRRVAEQYYATLKEGTDAKVVLDAYAQGVTFYMQKIRDGSVSVPNGWLAIPRKKYLDWDPAASLAIARLQTYSLSWNGDGEVNDTATFDAVRATFKADSTDPALAARAGFAEDVMRFDPPAKVPVLGAAPTTKSKSGGKPSAHPFAPRAPLPKEMLEATRPVLEAGRKAVDTFFGRKPGLGSNNFIVMPDRSATGKSLVASDPHLALRAPAIFHMVALHVIPGDGSAQKQLDVAGMAFAGIPGVVLGFNKNIAWGATVTEYDVTDVYRDKIVPDGKTGTVMVGGSPVAVTQVTEQLDYGDGRLEPVTIEFVPGHGVIMPTVKDNRFVPRDTTKPADVITYRWTGLEPTGELEAFVALNQAKNVDEAKAAMDPFQVGSQNFVFGDTSGNILYTTHSWVPVRPKSAFAWDPKKKDGVLPCLVLPGDGNFEWTGKVDDASLPQTKNPKEGYVATANSDQLGNSFDDDPTNDAVYLGCSWDVGFREARIHERIDALMAAGTKLGLDDLAKIQADAKSPLGARIAPAFVAAMKRAEDARTGKTPAPDLDAVLKDPRYTPERIQRALSLLQKWGTDADYDTPAATVVAGEPAPTAAEIAASQATLVFNASIVPLFGLVFDDEWKAMGNPPWSEWPVKALLRFVQKTDALATADASGESVVWDDLGTKDVVESKDDRLVRALLAGLDYLEKALGTDPDGWRWGKLHTVRFETLVSGTGGQLSIPPDGASQFPPGGFPRHGDQYVVDASHYGLGGSSHNFNFTYGDGPAQRFVSDMDPTGVHVRNALPGGNVWIPDSTHFADEAELWRKNTNAPIAFSPGEVVPVAEERIDLTP